MTHTNLMAEMLPEEVYSPTSVSVQILAAADDEIDSLYDATTQMVAEHNVDEATEFGLPYWERQLTLPVAPSAVAISDRRARIIVKGFLAFLPRTRGNVQKMIEAWGLTDFYIVEDIPNYEILVNFNGITGAPADAVYMATLLRQLLPSHLGLTFNFNFLTWDEFDEQGWDWNAFDAEGFTWNALELFT